MAVTELIKNENILNSIDWNQRYYPAWTIVQINLTKRSNHYLCSRRQYCFTRGTRWIRPIQSQQWKHHTRIDLFHQLSSKFQKHRIYSNYSDLNQNPQSDFGKLLDLRFLLNHAIGIVLTRWTNELLSCGIDRNLFD